MSDIVNATNKTKTLAIVYSSTSSKISYSDNLTISKGPMARKKLSREQYVIKNYKIFTAVYIKFLIPTTQLSVISKNFYLLLCFIYYHHQRRYTVTGFLLFFQKLKYSLFLFDLPIANILKLTLIFKIKQPYYFLIT